MSQFDVYVNPVARARAAYPFLLIMESDIAAGTSEHVVAPLVERSRLGIMPGHLAPGVKLQDIEHVVLIPALTSMPHRDLREPVCNLSKDRSAILAAVDFLFFGV